MGMGTKPSGMLAIGGRDAFDLAAFNREALHGFLAVALEDLDHKRVIGCQRGAVVLADDAQPDALLRQQQRLLAAGAGKAQPSAATPLRLAWPRQLRRFIERAHQQGG